MFSYLLSLWLLTACQPASEKTHLAQNQAAADGFVINGKVLKPADPKGWIVLMELTPAQERKIDSVQLNDKNTFAFSGKVKNPGFYALGFFKKQYVIFILDNQSAVLEIEADGDSPKGFSATKGGAKDNEFLRQTDALSAAMQKEETRLTDAYNSAMEDNNKQKQDAIKQQFFDYQQGSTVKVKNLLRSMKTSPVVFYALRLLDKEVQEQEYPFLDSLAQQFKQQPEKSEYAKRFIEEIEQKQALAIGRPAPEFELPGPGGKSIKLSSLRGKYVLVDFWASWCGPCRQENPNVVKVYNKYKNKNFEILGVSLDENKDKWVKAIEKDNLKWMQASDLGGWNSKVVPLYQLNAIPSSVLLDPNGIIIAKNLRGEDLETKLAEVLK